MTCHWGCICIWVMFQPRWMTKNHKTNLVKIWEPRHETHTTVRKTQQSRLNQNFVQNIMWELRITLSLTRTFQIWVMFQLSSACTLLHAMHGVQFGNGLRMRMRIIWGQRSNRVMDGDVHKKARVYSFPLTCRILKRSSFELHLY